MSSQIEDAFNEALERRASGYEQRIAALDDLVQRAWSLIAGAMSGNPHKPTANSDWMDAAHAWEIDYCMGRGSSVPEYPIERQVKWEVAAAERMGAAAGVAASEERIRRAEETRENANQASVRVELENERLKARLVAGEKSGNPYRGHDCIGDDCQGCAYEAGWDEGAEKRWVREEGWHKIRDVLIEADAIDADGLYPGWSADLTDEIVAALLSGEPEA